MQCTPSQTAKTNDLQATFFLSAASIHHIRCHPVLGTFIAMSKSETGFAVPAAHSPAGPMGSADRSVEPGRATWQREGESFARTGLSLICRHTGCGGVDTAPQMRPESRDNAIHIGPLSHLSPSGVALRGTAAVSKGSVLPRLPSPLLCGTIASVEA